MENKVIIQTKQSKRRTQNIGLYSLVFDYNFKILTITKSKEEIQQILTLKSKKLKNINYDNIISLKEFNTI